MLFLVAFSIKAGLFPLFFWLPASYHTPPAAIGAVFAGLLTKVGVYALIRIFTLLFQGAPPALFTLLLVMSAATMVIGLVAALNERDFRRILSFNLVGHIGYTTASLSLLTPAALAGAIFYVAPPHRRHHQSVPGQRRAAAAAADDGHGGPRRLVPDQPCSAALAMVPMFSLAGVPPLSGFLGKLAILQGAFAAGAYWVGGIVLVVGLLTLLSMGRTWAEAFWSPADGRQDLATPGTPLLVAIAGLSLVTLAMTSAPSRCSSSRRARAQQLLQRDEYMRAVLGGRARCCSAASSSRSPGRRYRARSAREPAGRLRLRLRDPRALAKGGVHAVDADLADRARGRAWPRSSSWELLLANVRVAVDVLRPRTAIRAGGGGDSARRHERRRDPAAVDADQHHAGQRDHRPVGGSANALRARHAHDRPLTRAGGRSRTGFERRVKLLFE